MSLTYRQPLHLTRGAGQYLFDDRGEAYLDCVNNVCHLGHCHPGVARAVARQMAILNTNTRYLYDVLALYVEKLLLKFPPKFKYCFLVNSGSEANDLALRLARNYTGGSEMLVLDGAYHGNLSSLIEISPYKFDGPGGKGAPPFVHKLTTPDPYRGPYRGRTQATSLKYASEAKKVIENLRAENKKLVGIIAEPMMGCAGQVIPPPRYLKHVLTWSTKLAESASPMKFRLASVVLVIFSGVLNRRKPHLISSPWESPSATAIPSEQSLPPRRLLARL